MKAKAGNSGKQALAGDIATNEMTASASDKALGRDALVSCFEPKLGYIDSAQQSFIEQCRA